MSTFARIRTRSVRLKWNARWVVGTAILLDVALVFIQIDARSFWLDEAQSVALTRHLSRLPLTIARGGGNFALYYVLLHEWLRLGDGEAWVRLLSAIPALATLPLIFALGQRLFDEWVGALAALALAVHPLFLDFARTARGYSLLVFCATAATYFLICARRQPRAPWAAPGYLLAATAGAYTQVLFVLVLAVHALWFAAVERRTDFRRAAVGTVAILLVLLIPLGLLARHAGTHFLNWIPPVSIIYVLSSAVHLFGGLATLLLTATFVLAAYAGRTLPDRVQWPAWVLLVTWLLLPGALLVAYSILRQPVFIDRYLIASVPAACLLAAAAARCVGAIPLHVAAGLLVVAGLSSAAVQALKPQTEDWRGAVAYLAAHARATDPLLIRSSVAKRAYDYAVERSGLANRMPAFVDEPGALFAHPGAPKMFLMHITSRQRCVWLIYSHPLDPGDPPGSATLTADLLRTLADPVETRNFGKDISITLYRAPGLHASACQTPVAKISHAL